MAGIKHHKQTSEPDNPDFDVSANEWNEDHDIDDTSIPVAKLSDHTKGVHDALGLSHDSLSDVSLNDHISSGTIKTTLSFAVVGTLTTGNDKAPTILAPCTLTIVKVKVVVKTAPTGSSIIVDANKNGTTIFTTQANRPEIAIGETTDDSGTPDVTSLSEGDKITIDIDQIGSTVAGADLTVEVVCNQSVVFA